MHFEINRTVSAPLIEKKNINQVLIKAQRILKLSNIYRISIAIVDNKKIKQLNNKYRKRNMATDVLSFGNCQGDSFVDPINKSYLGEIVISIDKVKHQARQNKHSVQKEFNILLIHGLLHLRGYDHIKKKDYKIMNNLEKKIFK